MIRVLHFGDAHFEKDKLDKCIASADFIVAQAKELKPDIIVNGGDTFNRLQSLNAKSAVSAAKSFIVSLADIAPLVIIKGNEAHDSAGCLEIFKDLDTAYPIYATERAGTVLLGRQSLRPFDQFEDGGLERADAVIHLLSYPEKAWFLADKPGLSIDESNALIQDAIRKIMLGFGAISADAKCPVVLVGHGNILGAVLSSGQGLIGQDIILSKHDLALAGTDVQCWDHIHDCQQVGPNIWYSGSTYHCNWGETKPKFILLHEIERGSCATTPIEIPSRPLSLHEASWEVGVGWHDEREAVADFHDWEDADLRVRLHVTKEASALVDDKSVCDLYPGAASYTIERIVTPDERIRSSEITTAKTLREKLLEWGKSIEKEISPEVLEMADEAERECSI